MPEGKAVLYVHKDGYFPFVESITVKVGDNLLAVELLPQGKKLDASVGSADAPLYTMKGDTLVYNASAVKTLPGDYAIDILRQMPGAALLIFICFFWGGFNNLLSLRQSVVDRYEIYMFEKNPAVHLLVVRLFRFCPDG